ERNQPEGQHIARRGRGINRRDSISSGGGEESTGGTAYRPERMEINRIGSISTDYYLPFLT
ncbi:hypothetical protein, partial [Virgibacillus alimentarius]|uniref:hypothetical protein n=1 Tax=Virgibacillus alimentarius TaxID=698769 RepID=UPI0018DD115E